MLIDHVNARQAEFLGGAQSGRASVFRFHNHSIVVIDPFHVLPYPRGKQQTLLLSDSLAFCLPLRRTISKPKLQQTEGSANGSRGSFTNVQVSVRWAINHRCAAEVVSRSTLRISHVLPENGSFS